MTKQGAATSKSQMSAPWLLQSAAKLADRHPRPKLAVTAAQVSRQRASSYYGGGTAAIGSWRSGFVTGQSCGNAFERQRHANGAVSRARLQHGGRLGE